MVWVQYIVVPIEYRVESNRKDKSVSKEMMEWDGYRILWYQLNIESNRIKKTSRYQNR